MPSRNHNKVHGKHRGRSNFRPFTVTLYINTHTGSCLVQRLQGCRCGYDLVSSDRYFEGYRAESHHHIWALQRRLFGTSKLITGSSNEIFPGWKHIVSSWSIAVGPTGTTGIIRFNQEIPTTSKILIEATIQSSPALTATIKFPVPLTIAGINGTGQGILFEIYSMYLGVNTTPGSIKLICSSVITGANGVQGMNVVVQSNNLSDISDIIQIKGIYFKA